MKPITLEDLKLSPEEQKLILTGAQVFLPPAPDPEDDEHFRVDDTKP